MRQLFLRFVSVSILFSFALDATAVLAADEKSYKSRFTLGADMNLDENRAAEYVMRRFQGERLIPVRIMGGVSRPGMYYLPEGTDLLTAISLSGGLATNADSSSVLWSQGATQKFETLNLEKAIQKPKEFNPALGSNDVLLVEEKTPIINNNTLTLITVLGSLFSMALAVKVLRER